MKFKHNPKLTKARAAELLRSACAVDKLADQAAQELSPTHATVQMYRREAAEYRRLAALIVRLKSAPKRNPTAEEHAGLASKEFTKLKSAMEYGETALAGSFAHWEPAVPRAISKISEAVALLEREAEHAGVRSWESGHEVDAGGHVRGPRWKHDYGATIRAAEKLRTALERRLDAARESRMNPRKRNPREGFTVSARQTKPFPGTRWRVTAPDGFAYESPGAFYGDSASEDAVRAGWRAVEKGTYTSAPRYRGGSR